MTAQPFPVREIVAARRPHRKDAARNYDALLAAAREAFAEHGADASLEDIARRAGVGIGTLYRNFPTRRHLFESVYADEVNALCQVAEEVADREPWDALTAWLDRFAGYMVTKRAVREALNDESEIFAACRASMYAAGGPLFTRAQQAGRGAHGHGLRGPAAHGLGHHRDDLRRRRPARPGAVRRPRRRADHPLRSTP